MCVQNASSTVSSVTNTLEAFCSMQVVQSIFSSALQEKGLSSAQHVPKRSTRKEHCRFTWPNTPVNVHTCVSFVQPPLLRRETFEHISTWVHCQQSNVYFVLGLCRVINNFLKREHFCLCDVSRMYHWLTLMVVRVLSLWLSLVFFSNRQKKCNK